MTEILISADSRAPPGGKTGPDHPLRKAKKKMLWQAGGAAGRPRLLFQSFHHPKTGTRNVVEMDQHSVSWPGAGCSSEGAAIHTASSSAAKTLPVQKH